FPDVHFLLVFFDFFLIFFFFCFFLFFFFFFFFSSRRRHTRSKRDWSSDVCSSDLCSPWPRAACRSRGSSCSSTGPLTGRPWHSSARASRSIRAAFRSSRHRAWKT